MQQLVLDIEESRYSLLLQFLRTLDYVKVVPETITSAAKQPNHRINWLNCSKFCKGNQNHFSKT